MRCFVVVVRAKSVEIHKIKLKNMDNVHNIKKKARTVVYDDDIRVLQISCKPLVLGHNIVLLTPHNVAIPDILSGHMTF